MDRAWLIFAPLLVGAFMGPPGCRTQTSGETPQANPTATPDAIGQGEAPRPSWLSETQDEHFALPWLSLKNVDASAAEINARGVTAIRLRRIDDSTAQSELLRRLALQCSRLTAISLDGWTFSVSDLRELLKNLPRLERLQLHQCRVTTDAVGENGETPFVLPESGIRRLSVASCHEFDNDLMAKLLAATPSLEELSISDQPSNGENFDGEGWRLGNLAKLRRVSISRMANDAFLRRLLAEVPQLKSLQLWSCEEITGAGWTPTQPIQLEELELTHCDKLLDEDLTAIFQQTPRLASLELRNCKGVTGRGLDLSPLTELRRLAVGGNQMKGDFLVRSLAAPVNIESLSLFSVFPVEETPFDFSPFTGLKTLQINTCGVSPEMLATLAPSIRSLHVHRCTVSDSSVATMLQRLPELQSLKLTSIRGGSGYENDANAIKGVGWDFTRQQKLRQLELSGCRDIPDELVARIARQLPSLESLRLAQSRILTGQHWSLQRLSSLKLLEFNDLQELQDRTMGELPTSLESLKVNECPKLTGQNWNLAALPNLTSLEIQDCDALTSLGPGLPASLHKLHVRDCRKLTAHELGFAGLDALESLAFHECHPLDVDRLFAELPRHASSLRTLDLTGCPNLTSSGWDLSPLKQSLREIIYPEGEPSYVGGIDEANWRILQQQLPDSKIVR